VTTLPDLMSPPPTRSVRRPRTAQAPVAAARAAWNWPLWFVVGYVLFQVALLFLGSTPLRAPLRIAAFSLSLVMLVLLPPGRRSLRHPAMWILPAVLLCLVPGLFMPGQPSIMAALGGATLYLSTLAPLLWVSHSPLDKVGFRRVILVLWAFNALSAAVGVLQVYYPGLFQAQLSAVIQEKGKDYIGSLTIQLANGSRAFRPMGLTDQPGGAATGGLYAILFGVGLIYTERRWFMRLLALAGMVLGLFVIYLTQVRVTLLMSIVGVTVVGVTFAIRGDVRRTTTLLAVAVGVALSGTIWAFAIGGDETVKRFASLIETQPADVYTQNRGYFLQNAIDSLKKYPLGAGLGRWGMINYYFGKDDGSVLWAEIMWEAWIYDGGIPLMAMYCVLMAAVVVASLRIAVTRGGGVLAIWGAVVLAYNLAAIAATFDSPIFGSQAGLEVWFLNAILYNAWANRPAVAARARPGRAAAPPSLVAAAPTAPTAALPAGF
jgi:hypothetical protein